MITEATLRVRPAAARRAATRAGRSAASRRAARRSACWSRRAPPPDVARLSDEDETRLTMALAATGSATERAGPRATCGCAATRAAASRSSASRARRTSVERRRRRTAALLRAGGGVALGHRPGRGLAAGAASRAPYLRDELLDRGVMVETLETATTWTNLGTLYAAVREALRGALGGRGTPPLVMCHVSHLYPSGASLYFTFMARQEAGRRARPVARRQDRGLATRSSRTAARSPTTTRSGATTRRGCTAEVGELGRRGAARREGAARPGRDHEPREAAARPSRRAR